MKSASLGAKAYLPPGLKDVDTKLVEEALKIQGLIAQIPSKVAEGSKWFFISMSWFDQWKRYVHFDKVEGQPDETIKAGDRYHPGKIDCSDII